MSIGFGFPLAWATDTNVLRALFANASVAYQRVGNCFIRWENMLNVVTRQ